MKHRLSLLIAAILAIGGPLTFAAESHASPVTALEKIFTEFEAALNFARDFDRASHEDSAAFVIELQAGPVELAFLPIKPAPARIEEASCRVPHITMASGYLRHAWLSTYRTPVAAVSNNPLGLTWRGPRNYDHLD